MTIESAAPSTVCSRTDVGHSESHVNAIGTAFQATAGMVVLCGHANGATCDAVTVEAK
jgi:hypothetical protein